MLMLFAPFASAGAANWTISTPINPDDEGVTINAFRVPSNQTIVDGWIEVTSDPMATSDIASITISGQDFEDGSFDGTSATLVNGNITLIDDGSISSMSNFDDNGNFTIEMSDIYKVGPGEMLWYPTSAQIQNNINNPIGFNSSACGGLVQFNISMGYDDNFDNTLNDYEIIQTEEICMNNQTIQNGSGGLVDFNGTVQNGIVSYINSTLPVGDINCPHGGEFFQWGNDFGSFYDGNSSLNSTEIDGDFIFCRANAPIWAASLLDHSGTIIGAEQHLTHGIIPATPYEGEVVVGTLPGQPVLPGTDSYLIIPEFNTPTTPETVVNYSFSFNHWHDLESGDGVWVEYRLSGGNWTWLPLDTGYTHSIPVGDIDVEGTPDSTSIPVFGGDTHSGWISSSIDLSTISDITDSAIIQFRFRIVTTESSSGSPGWFIDNIDYSNDGAVYGLWHHGCDLNGYSYQYYPTSSNASTAQTCRYTNSQYANLTHNGLSLVGVEEIQFDLHWDLEGSVYDNTCIEISKDGGTTWYDISSTNSLGVNTNECRSRSGNIPNYGYQDVNGVSYTDDSGTFRTISTSVPSEYRVANAALRFSIQTDSSVQYGGSSVSDPDGREGLTIGAIKAMDSNGAVLTKLYLDENTSTSWNMDTSSWGSPPTPTNEWQRINTTIDELSSQVGFEDSAISEPLLPDFDGFSRTTTKPGCTNDYTCGWDLTPLVSDDFGPSEEASYPYAYAIGAEGFFNGAVAEASLITPEITVPETGVMFFNFDMWICWHYYYSFYSRHYHGGALMVQVNNGTWEHVDPGNWYTDNDVMTTYSSGTAYPTTPIDGERIWTDEHCNDSEFTSYELPLADWGGNDIRLKFIAADKYPYTTTAHGDQGWFIDNVGTRLGNFEDPGNWISQPIKLDGLDNFNHGIIEIQGKFDENSSLTGSILDNETGQTITGFDQLDFPVNLAGIDVESHPEVKIRLDLGTTSNLSTPFVSNIEIGGPRILTTDLFDFNGWDIPSGIEVVDGLFNATLVTGTISSDYIDSVRPIKKINFLGNVSSNVGIEVFDYLGNTIGNTSFGGSIDFVNPINGYSVEITLPPNGFIEEMRVKSVYAEPGRDMAIDVAEDGQDDWDMYYSGGRGHLGWQTTMLDNPPSTTPNQESFSSKELYLAAGVAQTVSVLIPAEAIVNSGLLAITSDGDGFNSPIVVDVNGYQSTTSTSNSQLTYHQLSPNQAATISAMPGTWTDSNPNNRVWKEVEISFESSVTQTVTVSRLAISYSLTEMVTGLEGALSNYQNVAAAENPTLVNINLPTNITASAGQLSIDGEIIYELMINNKDFSVPPAFHPDGTTHEIVTAHRHLLDNSNLQTISLEGQASDGETILFEVYNSPDGLWGESSSEVTFAQTSGSELMSLDLDSSSVQIVDGGDGWMDVEVTWKFDLSWNWDDVDKIRWVAQAYDSSGYTIWPATSASGVSGNAIENDLQVDSFEIRDQFNRLLSNQFSPFYPFPVIPGSQINVTGSVRFQDTQNTVPLPDDFEVRLNLSGSIYLLESGDNGQFSGIFNTPADILEIEASPDLFRVGPLSGSIGANDVTGQPPMVAIQGDFNPPTAGPLEVITPTGLKDSDGIVWDPSSPLNLFVTVDEPEARGDSITLRYWRTGIDDMNSNGIAEEEEYLSQIFPLITSMTGQEQVNFAQIDVSSVPFNGEVYAYLEGADWAGLTYQDGSTGGGPGAENAWSTIIVAVDEPTTIMPNGYQLDSHTGYLLAGETHTFRMQISEPNGLHTLDNITIMLCGDGLDELGKVSYNPKTGEIWTSEYSMITPLSVQTQSLTSSVFEIALSFQISWDFPWQEDQFSCKPAVSILDDVTEVAYQDNIGTLAWDLDNSLVALPSDIADLTAPTMNANDFHLYLRQGDEFSMNGEIYYAASGQEFTDIPDDMSVEITVVYGTENIKSSAEINDDGTWFGSLTLPMRAPFYPTMAVTTSIINMPGQGVVIENGNSKITVDSISPTLLFDQMTYPESSLTVLESDLLGEVLVTVTTVDEIGMPEGDLQVAWVFMRGNTPVSGTEATGELRMINDGIETQDGEEIYTGRQVFQDSLDFRPILADFEIEEGDRIMFWVTSTDRAGNEIQGLGSDVAPRTVALRVMEFSPSLDNIVASPKNPLLDTTVLIETYWSNSGKRDGSVEINLYELIDGQWQQPDSSSIQLDLGAETSSVYASFNWVAGEIPNPVLYIIVDKDFDNGIPVIGIQVQQPISDEGSSEDTTVYIIIGGIFLVAVVAVGFFMSRSRSDDEEYYYDDEDDSYYEDEYEDEYEEE